MYKPTVIDLFSGCGGLNEGFKQAGFKTLVSNDIWAPAKDTFEKNNNTTDFVLGDITKKNMIAYHILKQYQQKGYGEESIMLLMKENPRDKYFATINIKNEPSIKFIKKLGFFEKGYIFEKIIQDGNKKP